MTTTCPLGKLGKSQSRALRCTFTTIASGKVILCPLKLGTFCLVQTQIVSIPRYLDVYTIPSFEEVHDPLDALHGWNAGEERDLVPKNCCRCPPFLAPRRGRRRDVCSGCGIGPATTITGFCVSVRGGGVRKEGGVIPYLVVEGGFQC